MCRANLTTFGCKRTNRGRTSASARNFAERNTPGCASWSWPTTLQSLKNGNVLSYNQAMHRQVILLQKDWRCFKHQPASTATPSEEWLERTCGARRISRTLPVADN